MADVTVAHSNSGNGTVSPASPGSITTTANNLLILLVAAQGTSPTITTPGGWTQTQKTSGASLTFAMYSQLSPGGAVTPLPTLGGTIAGWVAEIYEFTATGANCGLQGSNMTAQSVAQLPNIFAGQGAMSPELFFCYAVARLTATQTIQNSGLAPTNGLGQVVGTSPTTWTTSQLPQAGVQGLSLDFFWGTNLAQGPGPFPVGQGLLSSGVASVQIAAWFNALLSNPAVGSPIGGNAGQFPSLFYQGMVGG